MWTPVVLFAVLASTAAMPQLVHMKTSDLNLTTTTSSSAGVPSSTDASPADEATSPMYSESEEKDCQDQIGTFENDVPVNKMRKYDVEKILEQHDGAPGKLNVTWNKDVPEFPVGEPKEHPLPDTDNATFWVYDYRRTDFKTYVRLEHALLRQKKQPDEHVDIRGELYWIPPDFCGNLRHAKYRVDPEGFFADVTFEYCFIGEEVLSCAMPASCYSNETHKYCVAAPSSALLASLVG